MVSSSACSSTSTPVRRRCPPHVSAVLTVLVVVVACRCGFRCWVLPWECRGRHRYFVCLPSRMRVFLRYLARSCCKTLPTWMGGTPLNDFCFCLRCAAQHLEGTLTRRSPFQWSSSGDFRHLGHSGELWVHVYRMRHSGLK